MGILHNSANHFKNFFWARWIKKWANWQKISPSNLFRFQAHNVSWTPTHFVAWGTIAISSGKPPWWPPSLLVCSHWTCVITWFSPELTLNCKLSEGSKHTHGVGYFILITSTCLGMGWKCTKCLHSESMLKLFLFWGSLIR